MLWTKIHATPTSDLDGFSLFKKTNYNSEQTFLNVSILVLIICNEKNLEILLRVSNFKQKYFASKQISL